MVRTNNVRKITKFKRSIKAISPVIATLLMIAIAVVASLVVYAWVSGYMGFQTSKAGKAIDIPSFALNDDKTMTVYVQNVGQGTVQIGAVYVNDELKDDFTTNTAKQIADGSTIDLLIPGTYDADTRYEIKVTTTDGTSITTTGKPGSGGATPIGNSYTTTTTLAAIATPLTAGQTNVAFSGSVSSSGTAVPNGVPVVLQYSTSTSGPWTTAATVNTASGTGAYSGTFTAPSAATYYFQAYFAAYTSGSNTWTTSTSAQRTVVVNSAGNSYTTTTTLAAITTPLTAGQTNVAFTGSVGSSGTAVPNGVPVVLQYSTSTTGPWTTAATVNTASGTGAYSGTFTAPSAATYYFQAYFAAYTSGSNTWTTSTSAQRTVVVNSAGNSYTTTTTLAAITTPLTAGQTNVAFSGSVSSSGTAVPNGRPVVLQYSTSTSGPWTTVTTVNTAGGSGGFSGTFTAPTAGTYYYRADFAAYTSGTNTWQASTSAQRTVVVSAGNSMHVSSIVVTIERGSDSHYWDERGRAVVTIVDASGNAVTGATVYGTWSGAYSGTDDGNTDNNGQISESSDWINPYWDTHTFTFTITSVVKTGWTYDSSANVETSDSATG